VLRNAIVSHKSCSKQLIINEIGGVEAAGVEPASENVTGQETTCYSGSCPGHYPGRFADTCSERTRNSWR